MSVLHTLSEEEITHASVTYREESCSALLEEGKSAEVAGRNGKVVSAGGGMV